MSTATAERLSAGSLRYWRGIKVSAELAETGVHGETNGAEDQRESGKAE
jgi:hypothetical protein